MGTSETEHMLLAAAERIFRSGSQDPFDSISYRQIAQEASYSEATVRKYFPNREAFAERFVEHLLRRESEVDARPMLGRIANQLQDRTSKIYDVVVELSELALHGRLSDQHLSVRIKLWDLADRVPIVRDRIGDQLEARDIELENLLNKFFCDHADVLRRRSSWLSAADLAAVLSALFEGLSVRSTFGSKPVPSDVVAKVVTALLVASIDMNDSHTSSVIDQVERVDLCRRQVPVRDLNGCVTVG